jgi:alkylation response protein AidB-like acyl-CoA dehydrogenase
VALILTDEQQMLKEAAKGFLSAKSPVSEMRRLRDSKDSHGYNSILWKECAEQGFAGVLIPENYGGVGFGFVGAGLIAEEMGRTLASLPFLSTAILGATAIVAGGTAVHKEMLLPRISSGNLSVALASDERARHAPSHITTKAVPSGNGFAITGTKTFVLDGHVADKLIIVTRTEGDNTDKSGITLFLVDRTTPGISVDRTHMVDSRNAADIKLHNVQVSADDVLGDIGNGYDLLEKILDGGRACVAAEMLGIASESFERTVDYLKNRDQFGKKIGEFQALQHRAAHLFCEIELGKSVVLKALQALDANDPRAAALISVAKAKLNDIAKLATNEAVQMHGGIGMTDDFDIGFFMKRARVAGETFGDSSFHGDRFARIMGY